MADKVIICIRKALVSAPNLGAVVGVVGKNKQLFVFRFLAISVCHWVCTFSASCSSWAVRASAMLKRAAIAGANWGSCPGN